MMNQVLSMLFSTCVLSKLVVSANSLQKTVGTLIGERSDRDARLKTGNS